MLGKPAVLRRSWMSVGYQVVSEAAELRLGGLGLHDSQEQSQQEHSEDAILEH